MSARSLCSWPVALGLGLSLIAATACNRGASNPAPTPPTATDTTTAADPSATVAASQTECRDWSDLDVASLPELPSTPYTATLDKVWTTILEKHYDPTLGCLDWPAIRQEYGSQLADAKDEAAAFELISQMLGRLGQSHLAVVPPRHEVQGEPRAAAHSGEATVPIDVRMVGGEVVVVNSKKGGHRSGIPGGALLLAVDDREVGPMVDSMKEHRERDVEVSFAVRRVLTGWLACDAGASRSVRYQALGAKTAKTRKVKCRTLDIERVTLGNIKNVPAVVEHRMISGTKTGYVHFNIWMIPLMPKIEAAIAKMRAAGMESLVIDLRGNPGGVGAMVVPLGRQLLSEKTSLGAMRMRKTTQTFNVEAGKDPFTGPVALLVDEGSASTSEIFAQALQDLGRVKVFGAVPSQGAALPSLIEELPGGAILQYVVADYQSPAGVAVEGKGVAPDTVVPETRQDFANGRDPVLEAAVAAVGGG